MSSKTASNLSRNGQRTSKGNFTAVQYSNDHGQITFGKVHMDGGTTSACMIQERMVVINFLWMKMVNDQDGQR